MAQLLSNILFANNTLLLDRTAFTATNNQTSFSTNYTAPFVEMYLNGVKLVKDVDFTATNGTSLALTAGAAEGDVIEVVKFKAGNIYSAPTIVAGTNINGGGNLGGSNTVTLNLDTNVTGLTSLSSVNITATGNVVVATLRATQGFTTESLTANSYVATNGFFGDLTGTVQTAAQPNITSVGSLSSLTVSGTVTTANTYSNTYVESIKTVSQALSANAITLDLSTGQNFTHTLANNLTYTFANPPQSSAFGFTLKIIQDSGASGYTVTWPGTVEWPSATAPTLTATANGTDIFVFTTDDGGTSYYGFTAGQAFG